MGAFPKEVTANAKAQGERKQAMLQDQKGGQCGRNVAHHGESGMRGFRTGRQGSA